MPQLYGGLLEFVFVALILGSSSMGAFQVPTEPHSISTVDNVGNQACVRCHSSISASYSRTSMAHASGGAIEAPITGDFVHEQSGIRYRVYSDKDRLWLRFERPGDPSVNGTRELLYFIGSGRRGRTYLFETDGFLFESPVNWYANKKLWDMSPAYADAREMPLNLPAFTSCLHCHVSGMRAPVKGTENRYAVPAFTHSGVACERCHGPGKAHVAGGAIVNPAKLAPARRDDICMQCHMEGQAAIVRPGRHIYDFRPGDNLSDYIRYYVLADNQGSSLGAVSQVEAFAQSACKRKSGDSMSCTSCHNPHYSPPAEERLSYYRGKCLACHGAAFAAKHHSEQADCTSCHMPSASSADIVHTEVTDHRILRRPQPVPPFPDAKRAVVDPPRLLPFPDTSEAEHDIRDFALAWASLANSGVAAAEPEAERLMKSAAMQTPNDPALLSTLAYFEQKRGHVNEARVLYQKALVADPDSIDAATNLGVIEALSGDVQGAIAHWEGAFERAPGRSSIGMNLAKTFCGLGQPDKARTYTLRVLQFNPDMSGAKTLLQHLNRTPASCAP